jgi:integrase
LREKRAITWDEHCSITACERNQERRLYYEVLWETGASQSDAAHLSSRNVDWTGQTLVYHRLKTGQQASLGMGARLQGILHQLPAEGPFFPTLVKWDCVRRSIEFIRRRRIAEVEGVSLHSYRYAWAERAFAAGYPERFAQAALGHASRAVHWAYARKAKVCCPALEEFKR